MGGKGSTKVGYEENTFGQRDSETTKTCHISLVLLELTAKVRNLPMEATNKKIGHTMIRFGILNSVASYIFLQRQIYVK